MNGFKSIHKTILKIIRAWLKKNKETFYTKLKFLQNKHPYRLYCTTSIVNIDHMAFKSYIEKCLRLGQLFHLSTLCLQHFFCLLKPHPALEPYLVCAWVTRGDVQQIKLTLIDIRIQEPNHFLFWV